MRRRPEARPPRLRPRIRLRTARATKASLIARTQTPTPAAILCGGLGTRLRGTLGGLPKSMAPLAGAPLLERLVRWAAEAGVARVWLCTGHGGAAIRAHFAVP